MHLFLKGLDSLFYLFRVILCFFHSLYYIGHLNGYGAVDFIVVLAHIFEIFYKFVDIGNKISNKEFIFCPYSRPFIQCPVCNNLHLVFQPLKRSDKPVGKKYGQKRDDCDITEGEEYSQGRCCKTKLCVQRRRY